MREIDEANAAIDDEVRDLRASLDAAVAVVEAARETRDFYMDSNNAPEGEGWSGEGWARQMLGDELFNALARFDGLARSGDET